VLAPIDLQTKPEPEHPLLKFPVLPLAHRFPQEEEMPQRFATGLLLIPVILVSKHSLHPRQLPPQLPPLTLPTHLTVMLVPFFPKQLSHLQPNVQRTNNLFPVYLATQTAFLVLILLLQLFLKNRNSLYAEHVLVFF
ncbi:hypothetical protein ATANTOWER_002693, partial [Ataeniobius toweri]|nr:hypothetical protein [Ataeniobius toweri]